MPIPKKNNDRYRKDNNGKNPKKGYITKKNNHITLSEIIIILIILIFISFNLVLVIKYIILPKSKQKQIEEQQNLIEQLENTDEYEGMTSEEYQLSLLKQGTERDRMEYYCGQFIKCIENKNYSKAYSYLYEDFKKNYFPTLEDFEKYAKDTYPTLMVVTYDDIDRQGDIYILSLYINSVYVTDSETQIKQRVVVQEFDYNNFVLSFEVI